MARSFSLTLHLRVYALTHSFSLFPSFASFRFYAQCVLCKLFCVNVSVHAFWLAWIFFCRSQTRIVFKTNTNSTQCGIAQAEKFQAPFFMKHNTARESVCVCAPEWVYMFRWMCSGDMFVRRMRWSRTLYFAFYTFFALRIRLFLVKIRTICM